MIRLPQPQPHRHKIHTTLLALAFVIAASGCGGAATPAPTSTLMVLPSPPTSAPTAPATTGGSVAPTAGASVYDVIAAHPDLTRMAGYFHSAGLVETLRGPGPFTVLATSDAALEGLPDEWWRTHSADVTNFFSYAIVPGRYALNDLMRERLVVALQGDPISAGQMFDSYLVREAQIVQADLEASNGVVHVIGGVLIPFEDFINPGPATIRDMLAADGRFGRLVEALNAAGLADRLGGTAVYTLFAPVDDAWGVLPADMQQALYANPEALKTVLLEHVVLGEMSGSEVQALADETGAMLSATGQTHAFELIDGAPALVGSGLLMWGQQVIQAPPAHVIQADVRASNGVIHVVDSLLLPVMDPLPAGGESGPQAAGDVLAVLAQDGRFTRFLALIQQAGQTAALQASGPLTLFAPADDAFALLSESDSAYISSDATVLSASVLYHVATPDYTMVEFPDLIATMGDASGIVMLNGVLLPIAMGGRGGIMLGDPMYPQAQVIEADIPASNGVIHVINQVLKVPGLEYP